MTGPAIDLGIPGLGPATPLARGGFAQVYLAEQVSLRRTVAVKVLFAPPADQLAYARFERECHALGAVSQHPNIVVVHDRGVTADGRPYLIMEYRRGGSLADRLADDGPMPPDQVRNVGVKIAAALAVAHDAGVIHRDVKPANILLSAYGEPALADFGIARIDGAEQTTNGQVTASLAHAAREVLDGGDPTVQSDVYSLGSTLFELAVGRPPYQGDDDHTVWAMLHRIMAEPAPPAASFGVPGDLAAVIDRALAWDLTDRYRSAADLRDALATVAPATVEEAAARPVVAPTATPTVRVPPAPTGEIRFGPDQATRPLPSGTDRAGRSSDGPTVPDEPTVPDGPTVPDERTVPDGAGPVADREPAGDVADRGDVEGVLGFSADPRPPAEGPAETTTSASGDLDTTAAGDRAGADPKRPQRGRTWWRPIAAVVAMMAVVGLVVVTADPFDLDLLDGAEPDPPRPEVEFSQARIEPLVVGRRYALGVRNDPPGSRFRVVVDDDPVDDDPVLTPIYRAEAGRHRVAVEVIAADGTTVRTDPVDIYVSPGPPEGGFRVNLASVRIDPGNWPRALDQYDEMVADGHTDLIISESESGDFWQFYIDGFGDDRDAAWDYCDRFELGPDECFAAAIDPGDG